MTRPTAIRPARELKTDAGDGEREVHAVIDEIASELNLLRYDHHNPEAFLERRDFLVRRMRRLARRVGGADLAKSPTHFHSPAMIQARETAKSARAARETAFRSS